MAPPRVTRGVPIADSELIINGDGSAFHLHIRPEQLADRVLLVGDPDRVSIIKPYLDSVECEGASREFVWVTGHYHGSRITVLSTGIGADNIDIVMTELDALANIDFDKREEKPEHKSLRIVRMGTCGVVQPDIPLGSYILSHYSVGFDGLMNWYADRDAVTDKDMEAAFMKHTDWPSKLPVPYFAHSSQKLISLFEDVTVRGMTISAPGFYGPQGRVVRQQLVMPHLLEDIESFRYGDWRITNIEMEGASIAGMALQLGHEAITVCCGIAHRYLKGANTDYKPQLTNLIRIVLDRLAD